MDQIINNSLIREVKTILDKARKYVAQTVNNEIHVAYWNIGKLLVDYENIPDGATKVDMLTLSKELTKALGKGFSRSNLFNMKKFYLTYSSVQTLSGLRLSKK